MRTDLASPYALAGSYLSSLLSSYLNVSQRIDAAGNTASAHAAATLQVVQQREVSAATYAKVHGAEKLRTATRTAIKKGYKV